MRNILTATQVTERLAAICPNTEAGAKLALSLQRTDEALRAELTRLTMPVPLTPVAQRRRDEWEALDNAGICPECRNPKPCREKSCPRFWFDYGYSKGFHDGANKMPRHDHAFVVEMIEMDLYSNGDEV